MKTLEELRAMPREQLEHMYMLLCEVAERALSSPQTAALERIAAALERIATQQEHESETEDLVREDESTRTQAIASAAMAAAARVLDRHTAPDPDEFTEKERAAISTGLKVDAAAVTGANPRRRCQWCGARRVLRFCWLESAYLCRKCGAWGGA